MILLVCLKMALSLKTNNNSLFKSLNGCDAYVKIEKSSSKPTWLKNKQWSLAANFFLLLIRLRAQTQVFSGSNNEVAFSFKIISNAAISTQKFVNEVGKMFFENAVYKLRLVI